MNKAMEIIQKTEFSHEDRSKILSDKIASIFCFVCGLMKTTPQRILSEINIDTWKPRVNAGSIEQYEYDLIVKAEKGGVCDACEKSWKREEIKINEKVATWYYRPACTCYPRCIYCGRFLIVETKEKMGGCRYCGEIECYRIIGGNKKTPDGEKVKKSKRRKCTGHLKLKPLDHGGFTVYECDRCGFTVKKEIIV